MFEVIDRGPLPGLAELLPKPQGAQLDEEKVAEYGRALNQSNLPLAQTMSLGGDLRALMDRVLFRTLVRELPEENAKLPWFECHVPPGGTTTVSATTSLTDSSDLELKIFGSGLGRGRKTSITASKSSEPRSECATLALDLLVKPRIYEVRGAESVELEVVSVCGTSIESHSKCLFCGVPSGTVDRFGFRFGEHLDLRADKVSSTRKFQLKIEDSSSIDAGIELKSLAVDLKLGASVSRDYVFEIESVFPAGKLYSPYSRLRGGPFQTAMWATEAAS